MEQESRTVKVYNQTAFRLVVTFFAIVAVMIAPEFPLDSASGGNREASPQTIVEHAKTMPVSNSVITAKFSVNGNYIPVEASQLEGGLTRIESVGKAAYGFVPAISDASKQTMTIRVYRINQEKNDGGKIIERLNEVSSLVADKAGGYIADYVDADMSIKIEITSIHTDSNIHTASGAILPAGGSDSPGECCLECMGLLTCSGKLTTPCGGCCSGNWCNKRNEEGQGMNWSHPRQTLAVVKRCPKPHLLIRNSGARFAKNMCNYSEFLMQQILLMCIAERFIATLTRV